MTPDQLLDQARADQIDLTVFACRRPHRSLGQILHLAPKVRRPQMVRRAA